MKFKSVETVLLGPATPPRGLLSVLEDRGPAATADVHAPAAQDLKSDVGTFGASLQSPLSH